MKPVRLYFAVLWLSLCIPILSQNAGLPTEMENCPFLLRLQRTTKESNVCVLLRRDGQFHFENTRGDKTDVFEGALTSAELGDLKAVLNIDQLRQLTQQKVTPPIMVRGVDQFQVNIFRRDHWQNLLFPDSDSRQTFKESLKPLLEWLQALSKAPLKELAEDEAKNNCLPPKKIELKVRGQEKSAEPSGAVVQPGARSQPEAVAQAATTSQATGEISVPQTKAPSIPPSRYVVRILSDHISGGRIQRTCTIVYPSGRYRFERSEQEYGGKMKTRVFEASVNSTEVDELHQILDDPTLRNLQHQSIPTNVPFREGELTMLSVPRGEGKAQQLAFSSYFGSPAWSGFPRYNADEDSKLLKPLQNWLKEHVQNSKIGLLENANATTCVPESQ